MAAIEQLQQERAAVSRPPAPARNRDWLIALALALAVLALHAATGFSSLRDAAGDNDSLLRLVEVHDLLGGQGWFDLHQYRMGLAGGFVMHWSRLVDAPLAAIVGAGTALTGSARAGDMAALVLWPTLLLVLALWLTLRIARHLGGEAALFPAAVVGAVSLRFMGMFNPGDIDHHNVQLVLALGAMALVIEAEEDNFRSFFAGALCALMLAVGMETMPYVAVAGLAVSARYLLDGARRVAAGFGAGLGLVCAVVFVATVAPDAWGTATCDAFSVAQFALSAIAGFGLVAMAASGFLARSRPRRLAALAVLGLATAVAAKLLFPQCLTDPYAGVDPMLRKYWLDSVTEAQPVWNILTQRPTMAASYYATPAVGLIVTLAAFRRHGLTRATAIVGAFLAVAFLVSLWQVRGAMFSIPFAVLPLSAWIARRRTDAAAAPGTGRSLRMALAWVLSFNAAWTASAAAASTLWEPQPAATSDADECQTLQSYAALAALPPALVLASSNLGSPILAHSAHRVLAGPYHRNNAGNLAALHALMGDPQAAHRLVLEVGASLVAVCPGDSESGALARWAPDGLMAALMQGKVPQWLEPIPQTLAQPLHLYRVRAD